jgi:hypothetical protein
MLVFSPDKLNHGIKTGANKQNKIDLPSIPDAELANDRSVQPLFVQFYI